MSIRFDSSTSNIKYVSLSHTFLSYVKYSGLEVYLSCLKLGSHLPKNLWYLLDWKPFKNDEKCFLFQLKSSFCSQDIYVFVTTFWSYRRNGLIRKIRLTSKLMTSQTRLQTISIHVMHKTSQNKGNQTMKFGQLIEYNKIEIFLQKLCRKWGKESNSRPLFILSKSLIWGESKWSAVEFQYISIALNLSSNKNKLYKTLDCWFRFNFNFSGKF